MSENFRHPDPQQQVRSPTSVFDLPEVLMVDSNNNRVVRNNYNNSNSNNNNNNNVVGRGGGGGGGSEPPREMTMMTTSGFRPIFPPDFQPTELYYPHEFTRQHEETQRFWIEMFGFPAYVVVKTKTNAASAASSSSRR